jgi:glycosyltransferase involved in cell wall biosynthesis
MPSDKITSVSSTGGPPISVVLLNYNHGRFLPAALNALGKGLGTEDELIAFDDASTDDSVKIYREFAGQIPQMMLRPKSVNQGVVSCMNEGLATARNNYIYFAASDDVIDPDFLDAMRMLFVKYPQVGLASCRTRLIDENGRNLGPLQTPIVTTKPAYLDPQATAKAFLFDDNWLIGVSTIYNRAALLEIGEFPPELRSFSDGFISRVVALRKGVCYNPSILTCWRKLSEGYSSSDTLDIEQIRKIGEVAMRLMHTTYAGTFPARYPARWYGRWMFGAKYYGWAHRRALQSATHAASKRTAFRALRLIERVLVGGVLFLRYRPQDLMAVLMRRIKYAIDQARNT